MGNHPLLVAAVDLWGLLGASALAWWAVSFPQPRMGTLDAVCRVVVVLGAGGHAVRALQELIDGWPV